MKISENSLTTNQYTAVKSVHYETRPTYKGKLLDKNLKQQLKQDKKFHITKKCEVLEQVIEKEVAENSANIENKPLNLEGLFKKFNNR